MEDSNESMGGKHKMNMRRIPKTVPDLKLAESYIPGCLTWLKGMLYVSLCLLIQYGNYDVETLEQYMGFLISLRMLPFVLLYYDHLVMSKIMKYLPIDMNFIDTTSLCLDVVAGTIACQIGHLDMSCTSISCIFLCFLWTVCSALHVVYFSILDIQYEHIAVVFFVLGIMMFSKPATVIDFPMLLNQSSVINPKLAMITKIEGLIKVQGSILPYLFRAALYLGMCIIDSYFLRNPYQRESDRICMLRYGSILFSPPVLVLLSSSIMGTTVCVRIYTHSHQENITLSKPDTEQGENVDSKLLQQKPPIVFRNTKSLCPTVSHPSSNTNHINFDELDPNEAFKLAKLHSFENKATS
jgi:hypothetical protein